MTDAMNNPILRNIPSVNELLESPPLRQLVDRVSHNVVVRGVRTFLDNLRREVQVAASEMKVPTVSDLAETIADWIQKDDKPALRPVVNATGILLHTGLGRAPLAKEAIQAIADVSQGYSNLEIDLASGERSRRALVVESLLREITGAEAATVVNNNAAATLLTLTALAAGREVIVSRGQLIEIGGSFRLPDVMSASGAKLKEVGTTNKTHRADYESAITQETAALLRVHTSNFRVVGFTEEVGLADLVDLAAKYRLPLIDDIGSGAVMDLSQLGVRDEPIAGESLKAGADVVLFSGDKLLGGPQCGIIVGRKALIDKISRHPLARAVRVDKLTLAALSATLRLHRDQAEAMRSVPLLMLLSAPLANLKNRAERLAPQLAAVPAIREAEPIESTTFLGGGSVPTQAISTWCIALTPRERSVDALATELRKGEPSVVGRVHQGRLLFDLRSVLPHQDALLVQAVEALRASGQK
jgi:L-seryl-tRNA(Ser) seleniumtransferase